MILIKSLLKTSVQTSRKFAYEFARKGLGKIPSPPIKEEKSSVPPIDTKDDNPEVSLIIFLFI